MESILQSTKKLLGITSECTDFDIDIITHINTVFVILWELGVGSSPFNIKSKEETWFDYLGDQEENLNFIKTYIYAKVRMFFDPPNGGVLTALEHTISELEFRINVAVDNGQTASI